MQASMNPLLDVPPWCPTASYKVDYRGLTSLEAFLSVYKHPLQPMGVYTCRSGPETTEIIFLPGYGISELWVAHPSCNPSYSQFPARDSMQFHYEKLKLVNNEFGHFQACLELALRTTP